MSDLSAYNPWAAPVFPNRDDNAMQPETFVPQSVQQWTQQAAPQDYNLLSRIAGALGKTFIAPGQALQSTTPMTSDQMVKPGADIAMMTTLGAGAIPQEANTLNMGIKVYHGSPYDFNAFDMSKLGTGEGAQAYGHGLYFAGNEDVAQQYRNAVQRQTPITREEAQGFAATHTPISQGRMYEVNINADPEHFLDWDKPLSEQSRQTQDAVRAAYEKRSGFANVAPYLNGQEVSKLLGDKAEAATALRDAGIPGIKYLDQGSRGAGEGSHNYVVFNDKLIDILRKYAVPGMMGAPIFANQLGEQKS